MSRYGGGPILDTPDVIGQYAVIVGNALRDAQQQRSIDLWRQMQAQRQDQEFAYQREQDQLAQQQDAANARAITQAAAGQAPDLSGVTANGAGAVASMQQRMNEARQTQFEKQLDTLLPHVLNGSKLAMHNWNRVRSLQTGDDMAGEAEAFYQGQIDEFNRKKAMEREAKLAEAALERELGMRESLARARFAGYDTAGMDGTLGPSATPMAEAFVGMDETTQRQVITDKLARERAEAKDAAGVYQPTPADIADARATLPALRGRSDEEVAGYLRMRKGGFINQEDANISGRKVDPVKKELAQRRVVAAQRKYENLVRRRGALGSVDDAGRAKLDPQIDAAFAELEAADAEYTAYLSGLGGGEQADVMPEPATPDVAALDQVLRDLGPNATDAEVEAELRRRSTGQNRPR